MHRVYLQIEQLAKRLLLLHPLSKDADEVIEALTTRFWSHLHMISRQEAQDILGDDKVEFASEPLAQALDALLRQYENDFGIRRKFLLSAFMQD